MSYTKVLHLMWVPYFNAELILLLKSLYDNLAVRIIELEEDRME